MLKIVKNTSELTFTPQLLPSMPFAKKVLMVHPAHFNIDTPINVHMRNKQNSLHTLDKNKAFEQWETLKKTYQSINLEVSVVEPIAGLPDFVFCANQSFPYTDSTGQCCAILSNMFNDIRHKEVQYINTFLTTRHYKTQFLSPREKNSFFEGMGDALWLPGKRFILGGYGFRTNKEIYKHLSEKTDAPVALFELTNPKFYHLDTCLSILNDSTALICKEAFTAEGYALLQSIFPVLLEVPLSESDSPGFACNAHCPDGKHVIIQSGNTVAEKLLSDNGFIPLPIDTSEFIKSGGSVFCMKLMFF